MKCPECGKRMIERPIQVLEYQSNPFFILYHQRRWECESGHWGQDNDQLRDDMESIIRKQKTKWITRK